MQAEPEEQQEQQPARLLDQPGGAGDNQRQGEHQLDPRMRMARATPSSGVLNLLVRCHVIGSPTSARTDADAVEYASAWLAKLAPSTSTNEQRIARRWTHQPRTGWQPRS